MAKSFERPVEIQGNTADSYPGTLRVCVWTAAERRDRSFRNLRKLYKYLLCGSFVGLFLHLLLFLVILPGWVIALISSIPLHGYFMEEKTSVVGGRGHCIYCKTEAEFKPYLRTRLLDHQNVVTLQCSNCGQTSRAHLKEGYSEQA